MIDKTTYEAMKRENRYGLPLFYDYYLEHFHTLGRPLSDSIDKATFEEAFPKWLAMGFATADSLIAKVTQFYDQKFGL